MRITNYPRSQFQPRTLNGSGQAQLPGRKLPSIEEKQAFQEVVKYRHPALQKSDYSNLDLGTQNRTYPLEQVAVKNFPAGTKFWNVSGKKVNFSGSQFTNGNFRNANLPEAFFENTKFSSSSSFDKDCVLAGADFSGSSINALAITGSEDKGADFSNTTWDNSRIYNLQIHDQTNLTNASFSNVSIFGSVTIHDVNGSSKTYIPDLLIKTPEDKQRITLSELKEWLKSKGAKNIDIKSPQDTTQKALDQLFPENLAEAISQALKTSSNNLDEKFNNEFFRQKADLLLGILTKDQESLLGKICKELGDYGIKSQISIDELNASKEFKLQDPSTGLTLRVITNLGDHLRSISYDVKDKFHPGTLTVDFMPGNKMSIKRPA
jgi:uncharacterized protein YjbI with pentapeptide repeats